MITKDVGGAAFPVHPDLITRLGCVHSDSDAGMTLRDYFAAKAILGLLSDGYQGDYHHAAKNAYIYADAMLKERKLP